MARSLFIQARNACLYRISLDFCLGMGEFGLAFCSKLSYEHSWEVARFHVAIIGSKPPASTTNRASSSCFRRYTTKIQLLFKVSLCFLLANEHAAF
jgi:hypothetical protein